LEFDDEIISIEYKSFSCAFDINEGVDEGLCVEYESFSFHPVITNSILEKYKSKFVESETFMSMTLVFD